MSSRFPIPQGAKPFLRAIRQPLRRYWQSRALTRIAGKEIKKVIVGSSGNKFAGWVSTDQETLNLVDPASWARFFVENSLDAIMAEHVWEHLQPSEAAVAARVCYAFLKPGGYVRVAVPDGYHPDQSYIDMVKPGGIGEGASDHKVLYTYQSLRDVFQDQGFNVVLYEYFDELGTFHRKEWDAADGFIQRSARYDHRNSGGSLSYTSIILDAIKRGRN
jgi:predicted SAM-dependent methyltransferase